MDSGFASLAIIARLHQIDVDADQLAREYAGEHGDAGPVELLRAARALELRAKVVSLAPMDLNPSVLPALAFTSTGDCFVVARMAIGAEDERRFLIQRPGAARPESLGVDALSELWSGEVMLVSSRGGGAAGPVRFNLRWFVPSILKYRRLFAEVLVASLFLQLFALVTPLFFQVVMDKVLVHRGFTTLDVLAFGFAVVVGFEAIVGGLRNFLLSHTSHRIDVELGARLFRHLARLPMAYFSARQVGQTVARVRELDTIRNFITGAALTLVVDLSFTFVFIAVLWFYSPQLTWIVLGSLPFYVLLSALITPVLRERLDLKFRHGAANQAFLTETVAGMETVKSQALEPQMQRRWEGQLADYVTAAFRAQNLNNVANQLATLISRMTTLLIIWFGAHAVIAGSLTVGQLVAFNMIAGRVTGPILKLVQLWQDFQQAGISLQRLGDILNTPQEPGATARRSVPGSLQGNVCFSQVRFRYHPDAPLVLDDVSLNIPAGSVVGCVGRSGSGKSTLARLLQRLHVPEAGRVMIDGVDLAMIDTAWLRARVGVVQQDSFLFNRSVRENIAIADTGLPFDRIVEAARMAGAHDFILELSRGYDTVIEEQGANLSGGQRQRIAIARALVSDPSILIFDEATSALDYESERIVQENMGRIARNRTVIVIAHRLSTVRHCDEILVMDAGAIVEQGSHDALLAAGGYYARLHGYQSDVPLIRPLAGAPAATG
ncbi:type I secretion system permease/ATPase [Pseudohalioglobus sediminis]|uniref:Type I secretion system permease/ATPase n=1 Tax=Pseudohalioglobus sediminis TaxID=2606449 RepID=A0A5B0WR15_9GAMM|nr:type I secretion system permease/ATPase [Pseudohalioglobus sediminis]KAA1189462.1 type I secretion system permease/ATPase [Pseudohalioglobus sediminis]